MDTPPRGTRTPDLRSAVSEFLIEVRRIEQGLLGILPVRCPYTGLILGLYCEVTTTPDRRRSRQAQGQGWLYVGCNGPADAAAQLRSLRWEIEERLGK